MRTNPAKITLAALALAVIAVAVGATFAASSSTAAATRLVFVERELAAPTVDLGKRGFSPLDRQTIASEILDLHGNLVGRLDDDCGITAVGKRAGAVCSYVLTLAGGQLAGTRFDDFTAKGELPQPITGGSGAYAGARGQIRVLKKTKRGLEFAVELSH